MLGYNGFRASRWPTIKCSRVRTQPGDFWVIAIRLTP